MRALAALLLAGCSSSVAVYRERADAAPEVGGTGGESGSAGGSEAAIEPFEAAAGDGGAGGSEDAGVGGSGDADACACDAWWRPCADCFACAYAGTNTARCGFPQPHELSCATGFAPRDVFSCSAPSPGVWCCARTP